MPRHSSKNTIKSPNFHFLYFPTPLDHDKLILCLAFVHTSIFNTPHLAFFGLNQCVNLFFFWLICNFLPVNIFGNFFFDSPSFILFNCEMWEPLTSQSHLLIQISMLEIHRFKSLWYTCECNNWYKLWKSTKLGISPIL